MPKVHTHLLHVDRIMALSMVQITAPPLSICLAITGTVMAAEAIINSGDGVDLADG
jgi:hypothetical protein